MKNRFCFTVGCLLVGSCLFHSTPSSAESNETGPPTSPAGDLPEVQQPAVFTAELSGRAVPGGVAVVPIDVPESSKPQARFGNRDLLIMHHREQWLALVGLSPSIMPGNYVVSTFPEHGDPESEEFSVLARAPRRPEGQDRLRYNGQARDNNPVNEPPLAEFIEPGNASANPSMRPLDTSDIITYSTSTPNLDFSPVTESLELVPYGIWLQANKLQQHDYISYLTRPGAQVYAPADGMVTAMVSDNNNATTIYLDHGQGLLSVLGNLQQPLVTVDQVIRRGEQLATAGNNQSPDLGQVDWAVQLNGWLVDPAAVTALGMALQSEENRNPLAPQ